MIIGNHCLHDDFKIDLVYESFQDDLVNFMARRIAESGRVSWTEILHYFGRCGYKVYDQIAWTEARLAKVEPILSGKVRVTMPYPDVIG